CLHDGSVGGTQPTGSVARAGRTANGRTVPLQLAEGAGGGVRLNADLAPGEWLKAFPRGLKPRDLSRHLSVRHPEGTRPPPFKDCSFPLQEPSSMNLDALIDSLPSSAKDLKLNYSSLVRNSAELTPQQLWGTVAASAIATRSASLTAAALDAAAAQLSSAALEAAKSAAAIMGMNNIFYRFHHLSSNPKYATMPARLRMNGLRGHGVEDVDFELWSLAVSAINGCGKCVDAHE